MLRIAAVMGYYGITFSATNLSDDFYLNYELSMQVCIAYTGNTRFCFSFLLWDFLYISIGWWRSRLTLVVCS
jgi:hypothetical protein